MSLGDCALAQQTDQLRRMHLEDHLADASIKQRYVTTMFTVIAPRYDRFTRAFSYGMDRAWKHQLLSGMASRLPRAAQVIDLACGTGDLAMGLCRLAPDATVCGLDVTPAMVQRAQALALQAGSPARFAVADMMHLPYADGSLDGILIGYGVRNVPDPARALRECARVLRPGGVLGCLDFFRPEAAWWRMLFLGYLSGMGSLYGWWWHGHADVYRYIARSIDHFVSLGDWLKMLEAHGFSVEESARHLRGGVGLQLSRAGQARA